MINLLWFSIYLWALACGLVDSTTAVDETEFFYLLEEPIQEFRPKPRRDDTIEKPTWLYDETYPFPRVVEFYASWCPHCQHFKQHYIDFAKNLYSVTSGRGVTVETFAVSCVPNKVICSEMKVPGYPTLLLFPANSINGTKLNYWELHPLQVLRLLGVSTDNYGVERQEQERVIDNNNLQLEPLDMTAEQEQQHLPHFMGRSKKETFEDAHLSFDFAMRNAIYISPGPLPIKPKNTLRDFLTVLQRTFPPSASLQPVLEELLTNFENVTESDQELNLIMEKYPPPSNTWSPACLQHGTGYTCGLWELFHILSIGLVEWNSLASTDESKFTTIHVADNLRDYIDHFFQCDECRVNFLREYDACGHDRCNRLTDHKAKANVKEWIEFPLWLYETHNAVNVRLRQERIDAHDETSDSSTTFEVMWPQIKLCPSCWLSNGRWDEEEVYKYLRLEYWPEDYKSKLFRTKQVSTPHHQDDDSIQRIAKARREEERYDDDDAGYYFTSRPLSTVGLLIVLVSSGLAWHRKRKFLQKGYHKKQESDLSAGV